MDYLKNVRDCKWRMKKTRNPSIQTQVQPKHGSCVHTETTFVSNNNKSTTGSSKKNTEF